MAKISRVCDMQDCGRKVLSRGVCGMHYQRAASGDASVTMRPIAPRMNAQPCSIDGCARRARNRTWCTTHYQRWRQHGDPMHVKATTPSDCVKCGAEKVRNDSGKLYCKPCANATTKVWRDADPEAYKARQRAAYRRNIATHEAWRRRYYAENRERIIAQTTEYQQAHPEQRRKTAREWAARNPARCLANVEKRRARELNAICEHGPTCVPWQTYELISGQMCVYCGTATAEHADHYVPLSRGGLHCRNNLVPSCATCNRRKGSKTPDEWREYLPQTRCRLNQ